MHSSYSAEERVAWDIYFASLCAMGMHPGNRKDTDMTLAQIAQYCDWMIDERRKRLDPCPGS